MATESNAPVRGTSQGMRAKDLRSIMMVARQHKVIILVRHTNADALQYVGREGFYPKPAVVKAKTADVNPPPDTRLVKGQRVVKTYSVAGLVVHPGFQPKAYLGAKADKALGYWKDTMKTLAPNLMYTKVNIEKPETWSFWGVNRRGVKSKRWSWRVDVDPMSDHFGCLQLKKENIPWSYIHGDYDLKDVIVKGKEQENVRIEGTIDSVYNFTPRLHGMEFETIQKSINDLIGIEMVQHGAEAQFAWHGDEPITVAFPDWTFLILLSAATVQGWYEDLNRKVLGNKGLDYLRDASPAYHVGPQGMFKPGCRRSASRGE